MRKRYTERFDVSYTSGGKYASKKLPKWRYRAQDLIEYLLEDDSGYSPDTPQYKQ